MSCYLRSGWSLRLGLVEVLDFCSISDCGFSDQGCSSCVVCLPGMMLKILQLVCVETGSQVAQTSFELSVTEAGRLIPLLQCCCCGVVLLWALMVQRTLLSRCSF